MDIYSDQYIAAVGDPEQLHAVWNIGYKSFHSSSSSKLVTQKQWKYKHKLI
jgi:hypothetical protein